MNRWPTIPLGELISLEYGKALKEEKRSTDGRHPVYGSNGIVGSYDEALVTEPTVVVGRKGAVGEAHLAENGCWPIDTAFYTVFRQPGIISVRYLLQWFHSVDLKSLAITATIPGLNRNTLYKQRVPVPPLAEQERIVKLLDEADELRKLRARADYRTAALIPALFYEMFGDPAINKNKWTLVEFKQVVCKEKYSIQRGPFGGAIKKEIFVANGYKIYEQRNAIRDDFEVGTYFIDAAKFKEMENFSVVPDDLIVSCSGTIGRVAIVPKGAKPGIINQALLKVRLDKTKALPIFFKHLLETDHLQRLIFGGSAGSAIKNVKPLVQIKKTIFPLPPLSFQKEFAMRVAEIRLLEAEQAASRLRLEAMFQSLLYQAFQGDS